MKGLYKPSETSLDRWVRLIFTLIAVLSLIYYLGIGMMAGFGVSLLFVWVMLALFCAAFAFFFPSIRKGWRRLKKAVKILLIVVILLPILAGVLGEAAILSGFFTDLPDDIQVDCLIILGAQVKDDHPSIPLSERIETAYQYMAEHPDTIAIASGGQGADEPISEAQCIYDCLLKKGIDPARILLEDRSTSTSENLQYSAALVPENCRTVAVVTSNFHAFRGECIARRALPARMVYRLPASFPLYLLPHYMVREFAALTVDTLHGNLKFA